MVCHKNRLIKPYVKVSCQCKLTRNDCMFLLLPLPINSILKAVVCFYNRPKEKVWELLVLQSAISFSPLTTNKTLITPINTGELNKRCLSLYRHLPQMMPLGYFDGKGTILYRKIMHKEYWNEIRYKRKKEEPKCTVAIEDVL